MCEQGNVGDGLATRTIESTGKQPAEEIREDHVMEDVPNSDGGWIEDLDEEVPALRKLSDGENESDDASSDDETEFDYDESFLSTADEGVEELLGDSNKAHEMANRLESASHSEVTSSPRQNSPTSYNSKGFYVESKGFTDSCCQEEDKKCSNSKEVNDDMLIVGNVSKPETASQTQQLSKEVNNQSLMFKVNTLIDNLLGKSEEQETKETQGFPTTSERQIMSSTKKTLSGVSLLTSKGGEETQSNEKKDVESRVLNVGGGNIRIRKRKQVLNPKESDNESHVERNRNPDGEVSTTTSEFASPRTRSRSITDSGDKPTHLLSQPLMLGSSKVTIYPMNKPVVMKVKEMNPGSEMKGGGESVDAGKSVESKGNIEGRMLGSAGVGHENPVLKSLLIGNTSDQEQHPYQIRPQPGTRAEDTAISSTGTSDNVEGTKKHYPSVNDYVQDLQHMMKEKGIKSMVLKGPKKVITDVTKQLNDSKKYLFRLDGSKTREQRGIKSPLSVLKLNKSPTRSVSFSPVESKDEPLKQDLSVTTNFKEVITNTPKVSAKEGQRSELKASHSSPKLVRDSTLVSLEKEMKETIRLPTSQPAGVFKALTILDLVQAPRPSALVRHMLAANQVDERAIKTMADTIGSATATLADKTAVAKTVTSEHTKTVTSSCSKVPSEFSGNNMEKGKTTGITSSPTCSLVQPSHTIVGSQAKAPPLRCKVDGKIVPIIPTNDNSSSREGSVVGSGVPPKSSSSALPSGIRAPEHKDSNIVRSQLPMSVETRPTRVAVPLLLPKRKDVFRYVVICPNGQRKILQVPGGIPVQVSNALSGKPPIVTSKSGPGVGAVTDHATTGKRAADKELVEVTNEVLPSGIKLKRVTTRAKHVKRNAVEPKNGQTELKKKLLVKKNESTSDKAIGQPTLRVSTAIGDQPGSCESKQVCGSSPLNGEQKIPCEPKGDSENSSSTLRRSRRERKVARPYSPPPDKRRKFASSPSTAVIVDADGKKSCNQKQPACHSSEPKAVDLKKETEIQNMNGSSDHAKSEPANEGGTCTKLNAIIPLKRVKIVIKSEPLSDDEPTNSAKPCPNLAECSTIKTEPDSDSDSTDIPTDSDDNDNESCQRSAIVKGPVGETSSAEETGELPKVSETHHLSRAEQVRLLKQRIEEQEMMLKSIQKQRHQLLMERQNNPYLQDLY